MAGLFDPNALEKFRERAGLTQSEAARRAKVSRQRWNDLEKGRKDNIELDTLEAVAGAVGCSPIDLLRIPKKGRHP